MCVCVCVACMIITPVRGALWFVLCGWVYFLLQRAGHSGITADLMTRFRGKPLTGMKNSSWTDIKCIFVCMIYVYLCAGISESRQNYICVFMSVPSYCPVVCVCDGESRDHIQYSDRGFLFSLPSVSHTGRDCERRPAALASCTCKHDIRNEREREVS